MMEEEQINLIPKVLQKLNLNCLDLTGGAPELHPQFRSLVQPLAPKPKTPTNQNNENDSIHCCEDHPCNYCNKCTYCDCDNSCRTQTITRTVRLRPRATSSEPEEIDSSDNESEPTNQEHENQTTQPSPNLTKPQPAKKATIINLDDYCYVIRTNKTIKRERQREQAKLLKQHHEMMREIAMNY